MIADIREQNNCLNASTINKQVIKNYISDKSLDACLRRHDEIFRTTMCFRGNDAYVGQQWVRGQLFSGPGYMPILL